MGFFLTKTEQKPHFLLRRTFLEKYEVSDRHIQYGPSFTRVGEVYGVLEPHETLTYATEQPNLAWSPKMNQNMVIFGSLGQVRKMTNFWSF